MRSKGFVVAVAHSLLLLSTVPAGLAQDGPPSDAVEMPQLPQISLETFRAEVPSGPLKFSVLVKVEERPAVSKVWLSLDGNIDQGRIRLPYLFDVTVPGYPVDVCATADSLGGDSTTVCQKVASPPAAGCFDNSDCLEGDYCAKPPGNCGELGQCSRKPDACGVGSGLVCGCDGNVYFTPGCAAVKGVNVDFLWPCSAPWGDHR